MDNGQRRGHSAPAWDQRMSMEQQVVLGHLLPAFHAAMDWQDTMHAQRAVERVAERGDRQFLSALTALLHTAACWWQRRRGNQEPVLPATHVRAEA